ncbi:hypothetical protein B0T20DRAFT_342585, partial [Sordaria brevicollis]
TLTSILLPHWITYSVSTKTPNRHARDLPLSTTSSFHDHIGLHERCQTPLIPIVPISTDPDTLPILTPTGKQGKKKLKCFSFPDPRFCSGFNSGPSLGPPPSPGPPRSPPSPPSTDPDFLNPGDPTDSPDTTPQEKRKRFCVLWKSTAFLMNLAAVLEAAGLVGFVVVLATGQGISKQDGQVERGRRGGREEQRDSRRTGGGGKEDKEGWKVLAWMIGIIPGYRLGASWYLCMFGALVSIGCVVGLVASAFVLPIEDDGSGGQTEGERLPLLR